MHGLLPKLVKWESLAILISENWWFFLSTSGKFSVCSVENQCSTRKGTRSLVWYGHEQESLLSSPGSLWARVGLAVIPCKLCLSRERPWEGLGSGRSARTTCCSWGWVHEWPRALG